MSVDISEILEDVSCDQGWDEFSEIIHLVGFIESLRKNSDIPTDFNVGQQFKMYLKDIAEEENALVDS